MSESQDAPEEEPIEVEFTEAETTPAEANTGGGGPGWVGLITVGVIAALAGGAIGVVAGGTGGRYASASEVAVDISALQEADRSIETEITGLKETIRDNEVRLSAADEAASKVNADAVARIETLQQELTALKTGYLALLGESAAEEDMVEDAVDSEDAAPETDVVEEALPTPTISLASLMARLDAIETIGGDGKGAAPQELARSVAALQERTTQLEAADKALNEAMSERAKLVAGLETDISALEESLTVLTGAVEQHGATLEAGDLASKEALGDLEKEIEGLRGLVNDKLSNLEAAKLSKNEKALVRRADLVLALSSLETAIRSGSAFDQELEALAVQLPANGRVSQLRRFAASGAPTRDQLRADLAALEDAVIAAGMPEKKTGQWAWLEDIQNVFVTVREEGSGRGEAPSQKLKDALALMDADDLAGAVMLVNEIEGAPAEIVAPWAEKAQHRVQADKLLARLRTEVISLEVVE